MAAKKAGLGKGLGKGLDSLIPSGKENTASTKVENVKVKEVKVLKSIDEYGYQLKDNKTKKYKESKDSFSL